MKRLALALLVLAWPGGAAADVARCGSRDGTWVRVTVAAAKDEAFRARAVARLKSGLLARNIEVCSADEARAASPARLAADVSIAARGSGAVTIVVDVRGAASPMRRTRDVDVSRLPADGWPLAVASAADELVRAALSERSAPAPFAPVAPAAPAATAVSPTPNPPVAPSAPVAAPASTAPAMLGSPALVAPSSERRDVRDEGATPPDDAPPARDAAPGEPEAPATSRDAAFSGHVTAVAATEYATLGQTQVGADARASLDLSTRIAAGLRVGYRFGPPVGSPNGETSTNVLLAGAGLEVALTPRARPLGLESFARAHVLRVAFSAQGRGTARAAAGAAVAVVADAGVGGWVDLGRGWQAVAEVSVGAPLRAVEAADDGRSFTGVSGMIAGGALGVRRVLGR